jgi:hypothetical protein
MGEDMRTSTRYVEIFAAFTVMGLVAWPLKLVADPMRTELLTIACQQFREQPRSDTSLSCAMYIRGAFDTLVYFDEFWKKVCLPDAFSLTTLINTVVDYLRAHPEQKDGAAQLTIINALRQAYPCEGTRSR